MKIRLLQKALHLNFFICYRFDHIKSRRFNTYADIRSCRDRSFHLLLNRPVECVVDVHERFIVFRYSFKNLFVGREQYSLKSDDSELINILVYTIGAGN